MQISRHWRMNSLRYRLQGVRYENGKVSLQSRPTLLSEDKSQTQEIQAEQHSEKQPAYSVA
jgi:hypothetical protein